jgi:HD-like signal output (HDOD) protein
MSVTYRDLVTGSIKLVSVPELYVRLNEAVENPTTTTAKIGQIISQDPALTAHLLKIANSPLYGFTSKIDTISRAVMVIGTRGLRDLALAASAVDVFSKIPGTMISMASFWRHCIFTGVIARILAAKCSVLHCERLFVTGLLHDIGQLIIFYKLPEMAREALYRSRSTGQAQHEAERDVMGFDHALVGGAVLHLWNLPDGISEAVTYHHEPSGAKDYALEAAIVHLATSLASIGEGMSLTGKNPEPTMSDAVAWERTGLSAEITDAVLCEARPHFIAALSLFLPKTAAAG